MGDPPEFRGAAAAGAPLVAALTDYGHGPYRAMLEASVRYPHSPAVQWLDIDHQIALGDVRAGALTLRRVVPSLPPCVCVAVVDPGVGTERRAIAARAASGHVLVGPDNGLLEPALRRLGGAAAAVDLEASSLRAGRESRTFDGRDLFGPVAGALAGGAQLEAVGASVDPSSLVVLAVPAPGPVPGGVAVTVLEIDAFGTLVLALDDQWDHLVGLPAVGGSLAVHAPAALREALVGGTFADVPSGELVLYRDSDGALALALRDGSAARALRVGPGSTLTLQWEHNDQELELA